MTEPLLRLRNNHSVACGDPPIINSEAPDMYVGYFENPFGEQWVFTYIAQLRDILRGAGVKPLVLPARSPNLNAQLERFSAR